MQYFIAIVSLLCSLGQLIFKCLEYMEKKQNEKKKPALIDTSEQE